MKRADTIDIILASFPFLLIIGLVFVVIFTNSAGDVENFNELPGNDKCIVVDWEQNPLKGETINRSGIYCLTDVEK